jgi:hypothetical protein
MRTSTTITALAPALLKAQKKIEGVAKKADNPFFKSKYADLPSLMEACKDIVNDNGILILQPVIGDYVETCLIHTESGEWMRSRTRIVCKSPNDPQAYGSAITYARRYGLQSMLFMMAEDDDGEKAMDRPRHTTITQAISSILPEPADTTPTVRRCDKCGQNLTFKTGLRKSDGKAYQGWFCESGEKSHTVDFKWQAG